MKSTLVLSAALLAMSGFASAQTVTEITDPAKIAAIEQHAAQLKANPMSTGNGDHMDRTHHKGKMHHRAMHRAKKMKPASADAAAASDTPMATPAK